MGNPTLIRDGKKISFSRTSIKPGEVVTIAVPFVYTVRGESGNAEYYSNFSGDQGKQVAYQDGLQYTTFDQSERFMGNITYLSAKLDSTSEGSVFSFDGNESAYVVTQVTESNLDKLAEMGVTAGQKDQIVNLGYAVFKDVKIKSDLTTSSYPISVVATWYDKIHGSEEQTMDCLLYTSRCV